MWPSRAQSILSEFNGLSFAEPPNPDSGGGPPTCSELIRQVALWVEDPQVAEMMLVSTSRRGLTQRVTDHGVLFAICRPLPVGGARALTGRGVVIQ